MPSWTDPLPDQLEVAAQLRRAVNALLLFAEHPKVSAEVRHKVEGDVTWAASLLHAEITRKGE